MSMDLLSHIAVTTTTELLMKGQVIVSLFLAASRCRAPRARTRCQQHPAITGGVALVTPAM